MNWNALQHWFTMFTRAPRKPLRQRKLLLETLEGRLTPSALHVTLQPNSQTVAVNSNPVTLTSQALGGTTTPTVQWQDSTDHGKTWTNVTGGTGATTDSYTFTAPSTAQVEEFRAQFTSGSSVVHSKAAVLTVDVPPSITTNPASQTIDAGKKVTFTAAASATPNAKVQWEVSTDGGTTYAKIVGATSTTLSFIANGSEDGNKYEAVFTNPVGSITSDAAKLTVQNFAPVVTTQPSSVTVATGKQVTLTAAANGDPAIEQIQWEEYSSSKGKYVAISGATSDTYQFTAPTTATVAKYKVVFTNSIGSTTSKVAVVTVDIPPKVATDPKNKTVSAGTTVKFTATATASPDATVQWQVKTPGSNSFENIKGATSTILAFKATAFDTGNEYQAVFTNPVGTATTTAATLTISGGATAYSAQQFQANRVVERY